MSSFGETLKRERELRQVSLREISEATKVNLRYLEALERNDFKHLPGGVFNRGFVRAYAQYIGIDAEGMVDAYLEEIREQEGRSQPRDRERFRRGMPRSSESPVEESGGSREPAARRFRLLWGAGIALVAAALLVATGLALWRPSWIPWRVEDPGADRPSPDTTAPPQALEARVVVTQPVQGTLTCDGSVIASLDGLDAGASVDLSCRGALVLDATDGGAVLVGVAGAAPAPAGPPGLPVSGLRIEGPQRTAEPGGGAEP